MSEESESDPCVTSPSCNEKSPLLSQASSLNGGGSYTEDGSVASGDSCDLEVSELHKAKDFQLIHVPKGAVSQISICYASNSRSFYFVTREIIILLSLLYKCRFRLLHHVMADISTPFLIIVLIVNNRYP